MRKLDIVSLGSYSLCYFFIFFCMTAEESRNREDFEDPPFWIGTVSRLLPCRACIYPCDHRAMEGRGGFASRLAWHAWLDLGPSSAFQILAFWGRNVSPFTKASEDCSFQAISFRKLQ